METIANITRMIQMAISRHAGQKPMDHGTDAVMAKLAMLRYLPLKSYTDATRPAADSLPAGSTIYNSDDGGLNVTDGTNWRGPNGGWANT